MGILIIKLRENSKTSKIPLNNFMKKKKTGTYLPIQQLAYFTLEVKLISTTKVLSQTSFNWSYEFISLSNYVTFFTPDVNPKFERACLSTYFQVVAPFLFLLSNSLIPPSCQEKQIKNSCTNHVESCLVQTYGA